MKNVRKEPETSINLEEVENRKKLMQVIMQLFERWHLDTSSQLDLLGLSSNDRSSLAKYCKGEQALFTQDALDRIGWLLAIHKALRLLYPKDEEIRYSWITRRNQILNNATPLEIMREQGLSGLAKIAHYLDSLRGK